MSTAADLLENPELWQPLHDTVDEFRSGCTQLEQHFEDLFQDVDQLREQLSRRLAELDRERETQDQLRAELTQHAQQLEQREAELEHEASQLDSARGEFEQQCNTRVRDLEEQEDSLKEQRAKLTRELVNQTTPVERTDQDEALAAARREIDQLRLELEEARGLQPSDDAGSSAELAQIAEERDALEVELERVRSRAAELDRTIAEQQVQIDSQQDAMSDELTQLRRLVEKQADLFDQDAVASADAAEPELVGAQRDTPAADPVVDSVMAQFAKLQRDVASRRQRV